ncbi:MAG: hypothetical protein LBN10_08860 [Propionibacteriaceae bacterium]|jgi:hypothetical protein|nr:hypothetical protein [Propionibacteriaceae bacterium]
MIRLELRKVLATPAIWTVVLGSLLLNALIIFIPTDPTWPGDPPETENVFERFDAQFIADMYIAQNNLSESAAENVRTLYGRVQPVVDESAKHADALSPYLGFLTGWVHRQVFGLIMPIAVGEASLLALTMSLMCMGHEVAHDTEKVLIPTVTGRALWRVKALASATSGLALGCLVMGTTVGFVLVHWDFSQAWDSFVSSSFNHGVGGKLFITWDRLTVATYLLEYLAVGLGVVGCFILLGIVMATFVRNPWAAIVTTVVTIILLGVGPRLLPQASVARAIGESSPLGLLLSSPQWLTDGDVNAIWPHFETWGVLGSVLILVVLTLVAGCRYAKAEL